MKNKLKKSTVSSDLIALFRVLAVSVLWIGLFILSFYTFLVIPGVVLVTPWLYALIVEYRERKKADEREDYHG